MKLKNYMVITLLITQMLSATIYEDAEQGTTDNWLVHDNEPTGATISNLYDEEQASKVIKLQGEGRKNAYLIGARKGEKAWNNQSEKQLSWKMSFKEKFKIKIYLKTTLGKRVLYYDYKDKDKGLYKKRIIRLGLGQQTMSGQWRHITRDLEADLQKYEPQNHITAVNGMKIQGSGKIDNIELNKASENQDDGNEMQFTKSDITTMENISKLSKQSVLLDDGTSIKKVCKQHLEDEYIFTCTVVAINKEGKTQNLIEDTIVFNVVPNDHGIWDLEEENSESINYTLYKEGNRLYIFKKYYFFSDGGVCDSETALGLILFDISDGSNIKKLKEVNIEAGAKNYLREDNKFMVKAFDVKECGAIPEEGLIEIKDLKGENHETYNINRELYYFRHPQGYGFKGVIGAYIISGITSSTNNFIAYTPKESEIKQLFKLSAHALSYVISTTTPYIYVLEEGNKIEVIHYKKDTKLHNEQIDSEGDYELRGTIPIEFDAQNIAEKDGKILVYSESQSQYITIQ